MRDTAKALHQTVIVNGYCIGCGACAVPRDSPFEITMNERGQYEATLIEQRARISAGRADYEELCPFGAKARTEDEIARTLYENSCNHDTNLGYHLASYAGYVAEDDFRARGSSGGMGTWLLSELLQKKLVDFVINVKPGGIRKGTEEPLFSFAISDSLERTIAGSKSRYYPVELSEVLQRVRDTPGRFAIVGLPCFIKSVRLLQRQDTILASRIKYCVGLVCGHLKSSHYAQSLAWQVGIKPPRLRSIDFRVKDPSAPANRYCTSVSTGSVEKVVPTHELFGTDWGAGAFKYKACDFCDDVFAETADVVLGDAWLPQYVADSGGTNILVTRNRDVHELVIRARDEGRLVLDDISVQDTAASQDAGLRHRRGAIGYRLYVEKKRGAWIPPKRFSPSPVLRPRYERKRQSLRLELRELSHRSFQSALEAMNLDVYLRVMRPVYKKYKSYKGGLWMRALRVPRRAIKLLQRS